jgi:hypothetical protein
MFWWNLKSFKELYPILERIKTFLVFIKWIVEKLKLNSKSTQAFRRERSSTKQVLDLNPYTHTCALPNPTHA